MKAVDVRAALGYVKAHKCTGRKIHEYMPYQGAPNEMHTILCAKCGRRLSVTCTMTYSEN